MAGQDHDIEFPIMGLLAMITGGGERHLRSHATAEDIRANREIFEDGLDALVAPYRDKATRLQPQELRAGSTTVALSEAPDHALVLLALALERLATLDAKVYGWTRELSLAQADTPGAVPEDLPGGVFDA